MGFGFSLVFCCFAVVIACCFGVLCVMRCCGFCGCVWGFGSGGVGVVLDFGACFVFCWVGFWLRVWFSVLLILCACADT